MKFSSSSIIAAAEQNPDTDQRVSGFNVTDQGYRDRACGSCHRYCQKQKMIPALRLPAPQGLAAIFSAECEIDHICPRNTEALWGLPGGASRFQCPGLARPLALYCADGLVLFCRPHAQTLPIRRDTSRILAGW
jgi:hypothetical protein